MNTIEHLLTCLAEECAEVSQDVSKALRFGLDDRNTTNPTGPTNRERIIGELNDLLGVAGMLVDAGVLPKKWKSPKRQRAKDDKVRKFMVHARGTGALTTKAQNH